MTVLLTWAAVFRDILCDKHSLIDILITKLTKLKNRPKVYRHYSGNLSSSSNSSYLTALMGYKKMANKPFIVTQLFLVLSL